MPRYRFQWANLPAELLELLYEALGDTDGEPTEVLRRQYGARPKVEFARDAWPTLLEAWLPEDEEFRDFMVSSLQTYGLGAWQSLPDDPSPEDELAYLHSCRNQTTLREAVLSWILTLGEDGGAAAAQAPAAARQPEALQPMTSRGAAAAAAPPVGDMPRAAEPSGGAEEDDDEPTDGTLGDWLYWAVTQLVDQEPPRDPDGRVIFVPYGSAVVQIFPIEPDEDDDETPFTIAAMGMASILVNDVECSPGLLKSLNEVNQLLPIGRVVHVPTGQVVLQTTVPAASLTLEEVGFSLQVMASAADFFDTRLRDRFGGELALADEDEEETVDV